MSSNLPIRFQQLFELSSHGINPQTAATFATLTMESDKTICIRDTSSEKATVIMIDVETQQINKFPITADSAIVNPIHKILALKVLTKDGATQLQVFNLDQKKKIKEHMVTEPVVFWRWISPLVIALITKRSVFHWQLDDDITAFSPSPPSKVFDRKPALDDTQLISYRADFSLTWLALIGIQQKDDKIVGVMQLHSIEKSVSQVIEAHAACFLRWKMDGDKQANLLAFTNRSTTNVSKLFVIEVGRDDALCGFPKKAVEFTFPQEAGADFPVALQASERFGVLYMMTKFGYFYLFDVATGATIYSVRISSQAIFVTVPHTLTSGILGVNRNGQVLSVSVEESNIIPFILNQHKNFDMAVQLASRANLPGADNLFQDQFNRLLQMGQYQEAARVAYDSPKGFLRTPQTIQRFQTLPPIPGQASPILQYFGVLLDKGKLNKIESLELSRPVLQQGRTQLIEKWLGENKLECTEELGDLVAQVDPKLAFEVYRRGGVKHKVVASLAEAGEHQKIVAYCEQTGYQADWNKLLLSTLNSNPQAAVSFATSLINSSGGPLVDPKTVLDLFAQRNMVKETTSIFYDFLKGNSPEDGPFQTRILEINLLQFPKVAEHLLTKNVFTQYDHQHIGVVSEKVGLYQLALQQYSNLDDIQRVIVNTSVISNEFLVDYFSTMSIEDSLSCLNLLLRANLRQNLKLVIQVAIKYSDLIGPTVLIQLFESFRSYEGLFYYLTSIVNFSQDPNVHFKYIEAAVNIGQISEVERICRESLYYPPEETRIFLKESKLSNELPYIYVCDRHNYIKELVEYLFRNNAYKSIENYCQKINSANAPAVIGYLIDLDCNEDFVKNLITAVRALCPPEALIQQIEERNRLKLLLPWLKSRAEEGHTDTATHNALAKIFVDTNTDPENFLLNNKFYDHRVVGKYCEKRNEHLAFVAYRVGQCDDELIQITNKSGMFKNQARYLMLRQDSDLWARVLSDENENRKSLIEQVIQTGVAECRDEKAIHATVRAFMSANLPEDLLNLLDKIVFQRPEFGKERPFQNLLIMTAFKVKNRVGEYINRLDNFDALDVAHFAINAQFYEEAFLILSKFNNNVEAVKVLLEHLSTSESGPDFSRAIAFADKCNDPNVYSQLARALLKANQLKDAIDLFIKANDPECFLQVIQKSKDSECWNDMIRYLQMCRKKTRDSTIDSELLYAFAKTDRRNDMEDLLATTHADIQKVGDRCFNEGFYEAARILFNHIPNHGRLASTLVKLGHFAQAVEAARKAANLKTWKEVNYACLEVKEFRFAQLCGINIILNGEELLDLIRYYELRGYSDEIISLLESGLNHENAHTGIYTELAILYSRYKPEKLMEHLKVFQTKLNLSKVIRVCEKYEQWKELAFLYIQSNDYDEAALTMIEHPVEAWDQTTFRDVISKSKNLDVSYRAIKFYLKEHPLQVNELLGLVSPRSDRNGVDHTRVIAIVRELNLLPLIKPYLIATQKNNIPAVNEALNELFIEEENFISLKESITSYDAFDSISLAKQLESHSLLEFRRVAAYLYQMNRRWSQSIELSRKDCAWKDAMETAAASGDSEICEELLRYFATNGQSDCFAACLFVCYDLIKPDVALELAWKSNMTNFAMPYLIQVMRQFTNKVNELSAIVKPEAVDIQVQVPQNSDNLGGNMFPAIPTEGFYSSAPSYPPQQPGSGGFSGVSAFQAQGYSTPLSSGFVPPSNFSSFTSDFSAPSNVPFQF